MSASFLSGSIVPKKISACTAHAEEFYASIMLSCFGCDSRIHGWFFGILSHVDIIYIDLGKVASRVWKTCLLEKTVSKRLPYIRGVLNAIIKGDISGSD